MSWCVSDHNQKETMCYLYLDDFRKKRKHESLGHELTWLHLRFYPKGRSDAWQVAPQRFRYEVTDESTALKSLNKTALERLED